MVAEGSSSIPELPDQCASLLPALAALGIIDLCQADGRPTLIFDLAQVGAGLLRPVFLNNSLRTSRRLLAQLVAIEDGGLLRYSHDRDQIDFGEWVTAKDSAEPPPSVETPSYVHRDFAWTKCTIQGRWRVISGLHVREVQSRKLFAVDHVRARSIPQNPVIQAADIPAKFEPALDWTRSPPPSNLPKHVQFIRSIDWAATEIGPMDSWPPLLRSMCNMITADPTPAGIFWGDSSNMIYNEAFIQIAGQKHPALMGQHPAIPFAEVWDHFEGILEHCRDTGKAVKEEDVCLFLDRHGFPEETYVSFTFTPLLGDEDIVVGNYHTVHESTRTRIAERRMSMLLKIGQFTATAQNLSEYWAQVLAALETNANDIPFAILYSVSGGTYSDSSSMGSGASGPIKRLVLEGSIGTAENHQALPLIFDIDEDTSNLAPAFRHALEADEPFFIVNGEAAFETIREIIPEDGHRRGFGDPFNSAIICTLRPTNQNNAVGVLIIGMNTRRPYDEDYQIFIDLLTRHVATSLASTLLYQDERRRGLTAAEQAEEDQARLSAELALRTEEIKRTEQRFARLMQLAPVGVFIRDVSGQIIYCNDKWYEFTGHARGADGQLSKSTILREANESSSGPEWDQLVAQKSPVTFESKIEPSSFSYTQMGHDQADNAVWILTSAYPELSEDGNVKNVVGYITDISQQKWAEGVQQRLVKDALESRRQQEYFIDMTSHEIRNPLSAIMHSADGILTWLGDSKFKKFKAVSNLIDNSIDAAQTVLYCAQHQKNIVDDILTLSKLDSKLLVITPSLTYPVQVVEHTLKMFETQFATFDMKYQFDNQLEGEYAEIPFLLDPSRLMQILINLITNAIKFSKGEDVRKLTVTLRASSTRPLGGMHGFEYFPTKNSAQLQERSGDVYLQFAVSDTGCGLKANQKATLFRRFSQASPRTHVQYGGSGLGLFICREIVELQGGQIGVASTHRQGSTFGFYIRVQMPEKDNGETNSPERSTVIDLDIVAAGIAVPTVMQLPQETPLPIQRETSTLSEKDDNAHLKILIVEDNLVNQRVLSKQLANQSCTVSIANHGQEALDFIQDSKLWKGNIRDETKHDISVILMDIEMPVMDGLTCTSEIRKLQKARSINRHIPIIAVTANARKEQINQIHEAGLDQVISKPFRIVELIALIKKTIEDVDSDVLI